MNLGLANLPANYIHCHFLWWAVSHLSQVSRSGFVGTMSWIQLHDSRSKVPWKCHLASGSISDLFSSSANGLSRDTDPGFVSSTLNYLEKAVFPGNRFFIDFWLFCVSIMHFLFCCSQAFQVHQFGSVNKAWFYQSPANGPSSGTELRSRFARVDYVTSYIFSEEICCPALIRECQLLIVWTARQTFSVCTTFLSEKN